MKKSSTIYLILLFIFLLSIFGFFVKNKKIDTREEEKVTNKNMDERQEESTTTNIEEKATTTEEEIISKSNSFENLQYTELDKKDWNTYRNEKYGYEIKYPKDVKIHFASESNGEAPRSLSLFIGEKSIIDLLTWDPYHNSVANDYKNTELALKVQNLSTEEYVKYIWEINKKESSSKKEVGEIEKFKIGNLDTLRIKMTHSFLSNNGSYFIDDSYFTYLSNGKYRYEIRSDSTNLGLNIVNSFRLLK